MPGHDSQRKIFPEIGHFRDRFPSRRLLALGLLSLGFLASGLLGIPGLAEVRGADGKGDAKGSKGPPVNVLFIVSDDQRADTIAALGNPAIKTPHLDTLAKEGFAFRNAY